MLGLGSRRKVPKMSIGVGRGTESRGEDIQGGAGRVSPQDLEVLRKRRGW